MLSLSENKLSGPLPDAMAGLVNLKYVVLLCYALTSCTQCELKDGAAVCARTLLGMFICLCSVVRWLWLDSNQFSGRIPAAIGAMHSLQ